MAGLNQLQSLNISGRFMKLEGQFLKLLGYNQLVISLADLQVHLNHWRGSANYRRSNLNPRILLVSQNPDCVGAQPALLFIRAPFLIGTLEPISGLVQLKDLNLCSCRSLTGTVLMCGHNQHVISLADF